MELGKKSSVRPMKFARTEPGDCAQNTHGQLKASFRRRHKAISVIYCTYSHYSSLLLWDTFYAIIRITVNCMIVV